MPSPITALGNNKFIIRVRLGKDEYGKVLTHSETHICPRGETEAHEIYGRLKEKYKNKRSSKKPKAITLKDFIISWHSEYSDIRHGDAAADQSSYLAGRIISSLGHLRLDKITSSHLNRFTADLKKVVSKRTKKPLSTETIHKHQTFLRQIFKQAKLLKYIDVDPTENMTMVKVIKDTSKHVLPSPDEMTTFFTAVNESHIINKTAFYTLAELGLRREEVCALTWDRIDFSTDTIKIDRALIRTSKARRLSKETTTKLKDTKNTSSNRVLEISDHLKFLLLQLKKFNEQNQEYFSTLPRYHENEMKFVFMSLKTGYALNPESLSQWISRLSKRLGITKLSSHRIRHWFTTTMAERRISPKVAQSILGHSKVETTLKYYTHVQDKTKREACMEMSEFVAGIGKTKQNNLP